MIKNKLKNSLVGTLIVLVGLFAAGSALAADLGFDSNTIVVVNGNDYIIASGSEATSMVINPTTLVVVVPALSTFTLSSEAGFTLANDQAIDETCSGAQSTIAYTGAGTITITPTTIRVCAEATGGGGGRRSSSSDDDDDDDDDVTPTTTPTVTTPTPTTGGATVVTSTKPGTHGAGTTAWQTALTNAGFNPGPIDGMWGSKTAAAVKAFQASKGLVADGWPGAATTSAMNGTTTTTQTQTQSGGVSATRPNTNGAGTTAWQTALQNAGFNPGPIDGLWGPKTEAAVRAFQTARGLSVDGWPGAQTAATMNSL